MTVYVLVKLFAGMGGIEDVLGVYGSHTKASEVAKALDIHEDYLDIRPFIINAPP